MNDFKEWIKEFFQFFLSECVVVAGCFFLSPRYLEASFFVFAEGCHPSQKGFSNLGFVFFLLFEVPYCEKEFPFFLCDSC